MNFLSFFSRKRAPDNQDRSDNTQNVDPAAAEPEVDVMKDLFVEDHPPQHMDEADPRTESILKTFLEKNYGVRGFNDGYQSRSKEMLDCNLLRFKAEYRIILDQLIDKKGGEIFSLRNELIISKSLSDRLPDQLQLRIEELQSLINKLEKQKELSIDDEGWVMLPIHNYREGFLRGAQAYQEEKFLASSTGLFI